MNKMKKFLAVLLSAVMCLSFIPNVTNGTAQAETTVKTMTEAEKSARISSLLDFNGRLTEMIEQHAIAYTKEAADIDPYASARIIVKSANELDYTGSVAHVNGHNDWHIIQYTTPEEARKAAEMYETIEGVQYAEPDTIMKVDQEPGVNEFLSWGWAPEYASGYNFARYLLDYCYEDVAEMPEIIVAVLDTGCDSDHEYLVDRLLDNGYDFVNNDSNPEDDHGHGSHCAGTVVDGTLPNVKIMPLKVLGADGRGATSGILNAMEYAYLNGCSVANMSLGGDCGGGHESYVEMVTAGMEYGTIYCVAAGNEAEDVANHCPGNVVEAFTVAAHDSYYNMSDFSNFGDEVDITAPGTNIYSVQMGGGFVNNSGTSMATPHVAAACALVRTFAPNMAPEEVTDILTDCAYDADVEGGGAGFLSVADLVKFDPIINGEGSDLHFTSDGEYIWEVDETAAFSDNSGVDNSVVTLVSKNDFGAYQHITFDYKVSSEENHDYFRFLVNGEVVFEASGETGWQTYSGIIPSVRETVLSWEYAKDESGAAGEDKAYIRNVVVEETIHSVINTNEGDFFFNNEGEYPWVIDGEAVKSGNAGVDNTVSEISSHKEDIVPGLVFVFNYKVSSAEGDMFQFLVDGEVVFEADGEVDWTEYQYRVIDGGTHDFAFRYVKNGSGAAGADAVWVNGVQLIYTLESVLNVEGGILDFDTYGDFPWIVANEEYAISGNKGKHSTTSTLSLTIDLEAGESITFDYKVSSKINDDKLFFVVNGSNRFVRSGNLNWNTGSYTAEEAGTYVFEWKYVKTPNANAGEDLAYLDNIFVTRNVTILPGDCNDDGLVNIPDALLALRYSIGGAVQINLEAADVTGDGLVNIADALAILRMAIGG